MSNISDWFISHKLRVDTSSIPNAGLGVFATEDIIQGEVIERSPVILLAMDAISTMQDLTEGYSVLGDVIFRWNTKTAAIALGWGGLYNHDIKNNVNWTSYSEKSCMEYYAKKFIEKGEELFIQYRHVTGELRDFEEEAWLEEAGLIKGISGQRKMMGATSDAYGEGQNNDNRIIRQKRKNRDGCFKSFGSAGLRWKSKF